MKSSVGESENHPRTGSKSLQTEILFCCLASRNKAIVILIKREATLDRMGNKWMDEMSIWTNGKLKLVEMEEARLVFSRNFPIRRPHKFRGGSMHGEHISRRQCHGSSRIPSSAIPKMDKPRRGIRSRPSDLPPRTCTRNLFRERWGERRERERGGKRRLRSPSYVSSILHQIGGEKRRRGWKSTHEERETLRGVEFYFPPGIIF